MTEDEAIWTEPRTFTARELQAALEEMGCACAQSEGFWGGHEDDEFVLGLVAALMFPEDDPYAD